MLIVTSVFIFIITGTLDFLFGSIPVVLLYVICLGIGVFAGAAVTIGFTTNKELFPVSIAGTATGLVHISYASGCSREASSPALSTSGCRLPLVHAMT